MLAIALAISGCNVAGEGPPDDVADVVPPPTVTAPVGRTSLRGDPGFDARRLSGAAAERYAAVLAAIAAPSGDLDPFRIARRDDVYHYGRILQSYVQAVLNAFRVTGDLALLDHVDRIAEVLRSELADGWRDTRDGTDGTRDGYVNWVQRYVTSKTFHGKDVHKLDEMKAHGLIAMIAYALEVNRDLESPTGRDYAASADFWKMYLVDHFEAKWRDRKDIDEGFPVLSHAEAHVYMTWLRYHYYMGRLTGSSEYEDEANRMADHLWLENRVVSTPAGEAYVWSRGVISDGGLNAYLQPTTYARYMFGDMVDLHFEGFHRWADPDEMARFARTFTELLVDTRDPVNDGFAADIGGGRTRSGLRADDGWPRMNTDRYRISSIASIAPWDDTGEIADITVEIERDLRSRGTILLNAALFVDAQLGDDASPSSAWVR